MVITDISVSVVPQQEQQQQPLQTMTIIGHEHVRKEGQEDEEEIENGIEKTEFPCPMAEAVERGFFWGWASYCTFHWATPFLKLGASRILTEKDLFGISKEQKSRYLYDHLRRCWERERAIMGGGNAEQCGGSPGGAQRRRREGTTLLRALTTAFGGKLIRLNLALAIGSAAQIFQAITLGWLVGYFDDDKAKDWEGWVYALCLVMTSIIFNLCNHMYYFQGTMLGMEVKTASTMAIYGKILRLRLSSLGQVTTGHLVNLATTDVERFQFGGPFISYLWAAPLQTLFVLYFGVSAVGVSFLSGFAALFLLAPMQATVSKKLASVRHRVSVLTDERVKLTNQVMTGARVMKINAWELAMEGEIRRVRAEEIRVLLEATLLRAVNEALFFVQPAVLAVLVFSIYHLLGNMLKPHEVFTTLGLLNITQGTMGKFFYLAVQSASEGWVSIKRLEALLLMEENEDLVAPLLGCDDAVSSSKTATFNRNTYDASNLDIPYHSDVDTPVTGKVTYDSADTTFAIDSATKRATMIQDVDASCNDTVTGRQPGLISIRSAWFRWGDGGEGRVDELVRTSAKLGVPTASGAESSGQPKPESGNEVDGLDGEEGGVGGLGAVAVNVRGETRGRDVREQKGAEYALEAIDLRVEPGQLIGIVGPVGSAKSSLLMAVLREMPSVSNGTAEVAPAATGATYGDGDGGKGDGTVVTEGPEVSVCGKVAYAPQEPWIQSGTLKENILFGKPMNRSRYDSVVRDCSLEKDLTLLPSGDMTGIGDRGVNLSGGQKARVGLARMAYARADVYLMDDPLSAVDPAVGRELFSKVVCGRLAGSTRLLVTHQVHFLQDPAVDMIIVMRDGRIVARGRYEELEASGCLAALYRGSDEASSDEADRDGGEFSGDHNESEVLQTMGAVEDDIEPLERMERERSTSRSGDGSQIRTMVSTRTGRGRSNTSTKRDADDADDADNDQDRAQLPAELVVPEDTQTGLVKRSTYLEYIKEAAGVWQVLLILASMALGQALVIGVTVWIGRWSNQSEEEQDRKFYVITLAVLSLTAFVVSVIRSVLAFFAMVKASHRMHDRMLHRVIRAPVLFFDSNPVGRILNRFTKDTHFMDDLLPMTLYDFIMYSFMVTGSVLIVLLVNPWVVLSLFPAAVYFLYLLRFFTKTSREVKRLEAVTRSPVYSQLSETLDGLVTIRAFGTQKRFLSRFIRRVDDNTRAYFAHIITPRWFGFRMDAITLIVLTASCFASVAANEHSQTTDAGLIGVALVYLMQLAGLFQWTVRQAAEVTNQMVSAERILTYCKVDQEADLESKPEDKPADSWPEKGNIEIQDLSLRYRRDLPPVLKGLSVSIVGGSRVGVVGRTGAGKSSLVSALFRLVEYDRNRGGIEIDGVDTTKLGLHDLRRRMSVVPQTPFLFSGSMRLNLDPFAMHSDKEIWEALEAVQMKSYVGLLPRGLDALVTEGGGNLSVGQRQLLCLARAVLQRSRILVMDEATANIDQHTDSLIQDVVRTSFEGRTVIMIAHRLNTIIDCDQVLVLSAGRVVEVGHPHSLLQLRAKQKNSSNNNNSLEGGKEPVASNFSSMVDETGPASAEHLRRLAKEAWETSSNRNNTGRLVA